MPITDDMSELFQPSRWFLSPNKDTCFYLAANEQAAWEAFDKLSALATPIEEQFPRVFLVRVGKAVVIKEKGIRENGLKFFKALLLEASVPGDLSLLQPIKWMGELWKSLGTALTTFIEQDIFSTWSEEKEGIKRFIEHMLKHLSEGMHGVLPEGAGFYKATHNVNNTQNTSKNFSEKYPPLRFESRQSTLLLINTLTRNDLKLLVNVINLTEKAPVSLPKQYTHKHLTAPTDATEKSEGLMWIDTSNPLEQNLFLESNWRVTSQDIFYFKGPSHVVQKAGKIINSYTLKKGVVFFGENHLVVRKGLTELPENRMNRIIHSVLNGSFFKVEFNANNVSKASPEEEETFTKVFRTLEAQKPVKPRKRKSPAIENNNNTNNVEEVSNTEEARDLQAVTKRLNTLKALLFENLPDPYLKAPAFGDKEWECKGEVHYTNAPPLKWTLAVKNGQEVALENATISVPKSLAK